MKNKSIFLIFTAFFVLVFAPFLVLAGTIDSTNKYAWGSKSGWVNFNPTYGNVTVTDSALTGYVWSENYGWINLAPTGSGVLNTTAGALSGYAWGENSGWVNFSGVVINCSGKFTGSASGDVVGTISFDCTNCNVTTNWSRTSGCGLPPSPQEHTECSEGSCITVGGSGENQCTTYFDCIHNECDLDNKCVVIQEPGEDQCQEDSNCESHSECNDDLKCISVEGFGIDECQDDIDCGPTYNACVLQQCVALAGTNADECQKNEDCPSGTHNECNNDLKCVSVAGDGTNLCQEDTDCQPKHNECNSSQQCIEVAGSGLDSCSADQDCVLLRHTECASQKCVYISGSAEDQCSADSDCINPFHNECNSSNQCVSVSGEGRDQCQNNSDCSSGSGPGPGLPTTFHSECDDNEKCINVEGSGENQCQFDSDCKTLIPSIIETPVEVVKNIAQTIEEQIPVPVKEIATKVKKVIETPQGSVTTKTISTVGAATATAQVVATVVISPILDIFFMVIRLWGILMTALGIRKRTKSWGVVYDAVTKQPLDPAYVTLKNLKGETVASAITDLDGRYGFLVEPGLYKISANKTNYAFPSKKLLGKFYDEFYDRLYFGEDIEIKQGGEAITKNVPMDPLKFDWNEFTKRDKKLMRFYSGLDVVLRKMFDMFFVVGFVVALVAYFAAPYPYNLIILLVYLALLFLRFIGVKPKSYGRIILGKDPLSFAVLRVFMSETNVEVAKKVADKYGRFYCLVPKGLYYVKIEKKNEDESYSQIYTSPVINATRKGIIKNNFKI